MKFLMPIILALAVSCVYGLPENYYYGIRADFVPCSTVASLQTLWPDWNNNTIFHQCIGLNFIGTHRCPTPLLFSFWHQVCVWERDWVAPPPANEITPFPTTQWPGVTSTPGIPTTSTTIAIDNTVPTIPTAPDLTTTIGDSGTTAPPLTTLSHEVTVTPPTVN